jgi:diguanylate cyclase (GGDEF)-like protein/PAS domain S-box-containing protein
VLRDESGAPLAIVATNASRLTYALGYRTTLDLLGAILVLACISAAAFVWFLLRLRKSLAARHAVELRYRIIGEQIHDAIVLVDPKTLQLIEGNGSACSALGCTLSQLSTHHINELFAEIDPAVVSNLVSTKGRKIAVSQLRRGDSWLDAEVTLTTADIDGRRLLVAIGHDISHRREAQERERESRRKLLRAAQHDALTGLPNRAYLNSRLPKVLRQVSGTNQFLAVIYADLDHFKTINDCDGHPQGDLLLKTVARRLRAALGPQDVVARIGGDEFVIVAPLLADEHAVEQLAIRIRATVAVPIPLGNKSVTITVSQGIAIYPRDGADADTLLKRADIALYNAKNAGRHCHRTFSEEMANQVSCYSSSIAIMPRATSTAAP